MSKIQTKRTTQKKVVLESSPIVETATVIKNPIVKKTNNKWEIKDRLYYLKGGKRPLSKMMRSANLYWFDEEKGYEREIKYCENQKTCFVDEMQGDQRLSHIIFRKGLLFVPREKTILQQFLSLYHPEKDTTFYEDKPVARASNELADIELEIEALNSAKNMEIDMAEAIMRVEIGSKVSEMSSKELKRDLLIFAKLNPELFLELASDSNVTLRNFGIRATEMNILKLSPDQRTFSWGSNNRKLMNVPFDEHPYSALASWFKTDEGMEVYSNIEKQLK